jgi:hypothetical protein
MPPLTDPEKGVCMCDVASSSSSNSTRVFVLYTCGSGGRAEVGGEGGGAYYSLAVRCSFRNFVYLCHLPTYVPTIVRVFHTHKIKWEHKINFGKF